MNFLGFYCSLTESSIKPTTKSWFYCSSFMVMNDVLSSSQLVSVSPPTVSDFLRAERPFLPFFFFFFAFTLISWVRFPQSSLRRAWYSSTPPKFSVNSYSAGVAAAAAPPLTLALTLTGPPPPGAALARLRPATESALIVDEAGVAFRRRLAPKPKPPLLLWKGSSSSSSLSENSLRRFSFLYSSIKRKKSYMNFLMISICNVKQKLTQIHLRLFKTCCPQGSKSSYTYQPALLPRSIILKLLKVPVYLHLQFGVVVLIAVALVPNSLFCQLLVVQGIGRLVDRICASQFLHSRLSSLLANVKSDFGDMLDFSFYELLVERRSRT